MLTEKQQKKATRYKTCSWKNIKICKLLVDQEKVKVNLPVQQWKRGITTGFIDINRIMKGLCE